MKNLQKLYTQLEKNTLKTASIHNYVIPESWNMYGYAGIRIERTKEMLVEPYDFYLFTLRHILKTATWGWKPPIPFVDEHVAKRTWLKRPVSIP